MKKVLLIAVIFGMMSGMSCDDDPKDNEPNPYPDGVYPFEVSGVGHTLKDTFNYTITWTPPADKGFTSIQIELFEIGANSPPAEYLVYSSVTGLVDGFLPQHYREFVIKKDSFSFIVMPSNDKFVIIKCVDKFKNVSEGVRYEFSWSPD